MAEKHPYRPDFKVARRGYDRAQVETYLSESSRWETQAWVRISELEVRVAELGGDSEALRRAKEQADRIVRDAAERVDRFIEQVDAKAAELERAGTTGVRPHLDELCRSFEQTGGELQFTRVHLARLRETVDRMAVKLGVDLGHPHHDTDGRGETADGDSLPPAVVVPDLGDQ